MRYPPLIPSLIGLVHLLIAGVVVFNLHQHYSQRREEVDHLRQVTEEELAATINEREQRETLRALLEGLRQDDPYVVELLARERLGYRQQDRQEVPPPRLEDPNRSLRPSQQSQ